MAMIQIKSTKDEFGRERIIYCDTDDLSQENYREFMKLMESGKFGEAVSFITRKTFQ